MYKEKIRKLKREIILEIRKCLLKRRIESLRMTSPFKIYNEQKVGDDYMMVPLIVEEIDIYGTINSLDTNSNSVEIDIEELSVYDLSHLCDEVIKNNYKIEQYLEDETSIV